MNTGSLQLELNFKNVFREKNSILNIGNYTQLLVSALEIMASGDSDDFPSTNIH